MYLLVTLVASTLQFCTLTAIDLTLEPRTFGRNVVEATVNKIAESRIFKDDKQLLRRLAYVHTIDGNDMDKTYRPGYYGGIWQVDQDQLLTTQSTTGRLQALFDKIEDTFKITWSTVTWQHLTIPLYSALATQLSMELVQDRIPGDIAGQAAFFERHMKGNAQYFVEAVNQLEESEPSCERKMDIVLVLDASGSIGASNFVLAKKFVADLTDNINLDTSRVALLVYDSSVYTIFGLANKLQRHHLRQSVLDVPYYNGGTSTDLALAAALNMFATTETRAGTVKIVSVFTDGRSNNPVDDAAERVRRSDVKAFGVGIGEGSSINDTELFILAGNETDRVFRLDNYQVLLESIKYLTKAVCDVQEPLPFDNVDIDVVSKGEKRYMKLKIKEDVVIEAKNLTGRTRTFWSRTNPKPTSAVHDGEIIGRTLIKYKPKAERGRKRRNIAPVDEIDMDDIDVIYIGVEGLEERNNFTVVVTNNTDDYFETSTAGTVEDLVTEDDTVTTVMSIRLREHEMRASEHQLTMSKLRWEAMYWKARLQREFPDVALGSSGVDKGWLTVATYGPVVKGK